MVTRSGVIRLVSKCGCRLGILTVGGIKVGFSKSIVATNLVFLWAQEGRGGLLVNADTQETGPIPITFQN